MQEGKPGATGKKRDDRSTRSEALVGRPPRLQGTAGPVQSLSCWTLREALGLPVAIRRPSLRTFDAIPAVVARLMASVRLLADRAHRDRLLTPCACVSC